MFKWQGRMPGGFEFPASCLFCAWGERGDGFLIQIHSFSDACCLCKYCLNKWLLVPCICSPAVVKSSQSSCCLNQYSGLSLRLAEFSHPTFVSCPDGLHYREKFYQQVLLVPGNTILKFKEEIIFCVWQQGVGGLMVCMVWEAHTADWFLDTHMFPPWSSETHPNRRKWESLHFNFTLVELEKWGKPLGKLLQTRCPNKDWIQDRCHS